MRKEVQEEIDRTDTELRSLKSEVAAIEDQKRSLEKSVTTAQTLRRRVETVEKNHKPLKEMVTEKLQEYQELKEAIDGFSQWSVNAYDHTEVMTMLCTDEKSLRRMTKRMIDALQNNQQDSVKAICAPLASLQLNDI